MGLPMAAFRKGICLPLLPNALRTIAKSARLVPAVSKSAFPSGRFAKAVFRAIICGLAFAAFDGKEVRGQMGNDDRSFATKFFLDEPPNSNQLNAIPNASDLTIAKVRLAGRPTYLIGRDQSGRPPPLPKDLFYAEVNILQVSRGDIKSGSQISLYFGRPASSIRYKYPNTPAMLERDYYVVSQTDPDNQRRLVGFPVSEEEYRDWRAEADEYQRMRGMPGTGALRAITVAAGGERSPLSVAPGGSAGTESQSGEVHVQMVASAYATKYFLDQPPTALGISRLAPTAKDVTVAEVRIIGISWLAGRHARDLPRGFPLYGAEVKIVNDPSGKAGKGSIEVLYFLERGTIGKYMYPTKSTYTRNYFVAFFYKDESKPWLVGFPAEEEEYEVWREERLKDLR
jgi:hypothetical protein